jgi:Ca2+-binding EF-hand superfamily protein
MFAACRPAFRIALLGIALGLSPLGQGIAAAQDFGRGPADGQQPGQDPNRRRGSRTEALLQSLDLNHNGVIEANEVNPQQLAELQSRARRYGVDVTLPLSIDKFREAMQTYYNNAGNRRGPNPTTGKPAPDAGSNTAAAAPASRVLVSGSGGASATPSSNSSTGQATTWSSSSSSYGSSAGAGGSAIDSRVRNYAAALLRKYDKNHNGQLDREEWSELSGDWKSADLNGDGIITLDELTAWLMNRSRSRSQSSSPTSSSSSTAATTSSTAATTSGTAATTSGTTTTPATAAGGTTTAPATAAGPTNVLRRSYHFLSPSERLPSGLPEWFRRKDVNGDGQVTMAEFSDTWNDAVAAEFAKYDLNGDGVITAQECLEAQRKK